jgi:hypothetical protein
MIVKLMIKESTVNSYYNAKYNAGILLVHGHGCEPACSGRQVKASEVNAYYRGWQTRCNKSLCIDRLEPCGCHFVLNF